MIPRLDVVVKKPRKRWMIAEYMSTGIFMMTQELAHLNPSLEEGHQLHEQQANTNQTECALPSQICHAVTRSGKHPIQETGITQRLGIIPVQV